MLMRLIFPESGVERIGVAPGTHFLDAGNFVLLTLSPLVGIYFKGVSSCSEADFEFVVP
jgi:hypothetical protein